MSRRLAFIVMLVLMSAESRCAVAIEVTPVSDQPILEDSITESDRDHWSYQPIVRPELPEVSLRSWPVNAIDNFVLHELERKQLAPTVAADRSTLLRRLTFDLIGLPPTPEELLSFEQDLSLIAYQKQVDRLLASPAYGERWSQHWLDLARFAETDGFEHDKVRSNAWQYRQWVIDALNGDMPYDQFIGLQLTADLTGDEEDTIATMFCLAGPDMPDLNEQELRRHDKLNEITSTVGAALLGLQMHCAQCHDHKYDPISQADFYRLRGVFESAVPELKRDQPIDRFAAQSSPVPPRLYYRGELQNEGPSLTAKPPRIACSTDAYDKFDTSNPRLALSQWLFLKENTLTSRVIANRIWQHHFGKSLCENPSDLGLIASGPSHPELLDWLACEIRDNGWSMKHLHRSILLSATYQQASRLEATDEPTLLAWQRLEMVDPDNQWYGRFPRQRLEGEVIRDALLSVSGQLNQLHGGPSVMPPLPPEMLKTILQGQWKANMDPSDHVRRSVYLFARRNLRYPIFEAFDRPDAGSSCARRDRSTTAIQSLQMLNSDLAYDAALNLRHRVLNECQQSGEASAESLIERLYLLALSRRPAVSELQRIKALLESRSAAEQDGLLIACVAVLNANEFIYLD